MINISRAFLENSFDPDVLRYCFHGSKKTGQQTVAEQQQGNAAKQQAADTGAAQGTLSQFEGPVQQSPFYKALYTSGVEGTSSAYDAAKANMRQRSKAAGFGYNQPVEAGAEDQLGAREATDLAAVPREAMTAAVDPALRAAGLSGQMGMKYGDQSLDWNAQAANLQAKRKSWLQNLQDIAGPFVQGAAQGYASSQGSNQG